MQKILHIIDTGTPAEMIRQMLALRGDDEPAVCIGPAPRGATSTSLITPIHIPLGWWRLAIPKLRQIARDARLLHAWSIPAAKAAIAIADGEIKIILSLPHIRDLAEITKLCKTDGDKITAIVVPTDNASAKLALAGIDAAKLAVIPPPTVIPPDMQARRTKVRAELGISDDCILMAATSEMIPNAGHRLASWSHAIIRQMRPNYRLVFHGGGPSQSRVRFFAATTGYDSEVFFTGEKYDLVDITAACDIATFFAERDCGVTGLLMAMAAGKPIVAAATDDISEIAPNEQCAILTAVGDPRQATAAVLRLDREPQLAGKLATEAKQRAEQIADAKIQYEKFLKLRQQVMHQ